MTRLLLTASVIALTATAPAWAQQRQNMNEQDWNFARQAAQGGMAEVEEGGLAQNQATRPAVREFGRWMVTDHSQINQWLRSIARHEGLQIPNSPGGYQQHQATQLERLRGPQFDRTYIADQVQGHERMVGLFEQEERNGENPQLRRFARQVLPVLGQHLTEARELERLTGGTASQ